MKEKIYLIPGLMTDERLWSRLEPKLQECELIHLEIPLSEDFDFIVDSLNKQIKDEKINLLGFSLGGYIASYFAIKYPTKVKKLFLVSSTPSATEPKDVKRREKKLYDAKQNNFTPLSFEKTKDLLEVKDDDELIQIVANMFNDLGNEVFVPQLASTLKRVELFDHLIKLHKTIYFFYSTEDRLLNHTSINRILDKEHKMRLVSREGNSHNIPLEFPDELSIQIKEWLKDG